MGRSGPASERINGWMFKNQNSIRLEIEETFLMQARLQFPGNEIGNRFGEDTNGAFMTWESDRIGSRHGIRIDHGITRSKRTIHP